MEQTTEHMRNCSLVVLTEWVGMLSLVSILALRTLARIIISEDVWDL